MDLIAEYRKISPLRRQIIKFGIIGFFAGACTVASITIYLLRKQEKDENQTKLVKRKNWISKSVSFIERDHVLMLSIDDVLRSPMELLGNGSYGSTYKAVLSDGREIAVKKLEREDEENDVEFEKCIEIFGRINHENVVKLVGYYCSTNERFLFYEYHSKGSVYSLLHGKEEQKEEEFRNEIEELDEIWDEPNIILKGTVKKERTKKTPLNWEARLKIAFGAAIGLARIHAEKSPTNDHIVHGDVKSTNVLLTSHNYGCLSDMGPAFFMMSPNPSSLSAAYRAPELFNTTKLTQAGDVYSFGVFLLELLTGKSPRGFKDEKDDEVASLVWWTRSVMDEEGTANVFDVELRRGGSHLSEKETDERVRLLQIAIACVMSSPKLRPTMGLVVDMMKEIRTREI